MSLEHALAKGWIPIPVELVIVLDVPGLCTIMGANTQGVKTSGSFDCPFAQRLVVNKS